MRSWSYPSRSSTCAAHGKKCPKARQSSRMGPMYSSGHSIQGTSDALFSEYQSLAEGAALRQGIFIRGNSRRKTSRKKYDSKILEIDIRLTNHLAAPF
ncbi:hypothetical protein BVI2075_300043 [Burkholderia vietnamiensis]|nr:hypothetical protein BVI2075_300043 [Burkholderia vietnamiensis]